MGHTARCGSRTIGNTFTGATPTPTPGAAPPAVKARGPEDRPQTFAYERAADLVRPTDARLEAVRAAGYTSAVTFPTRGIFQGQGALINLAGERAADLVVAEPMGQQSPSGLRVFGPASPAL